MPPPPPQSVFDALLGPPTKRVVVYPTAIDTRWSPARLRKACEELLGEEIDPSTAAIFHDRTQRTLVLLTVFGADGRGTIRTIKKLESGAFLLPAPEPGEPYAVVPASKVSTLFRE